MMSLLLALTIVGPPSGTYRGVLDLEGATLRFSLSLNGRGRGAPGQLCNGPSCQPLSAVRARGDSIVMEIGDYAATITAVQRGDSLVGFYRNVGNRGPRTIPFRASRGRWISRAAPGAPSGEWSAWFDNGTGSTPRVLQLMPNANGFTGTIIGTGGDYGTFSGTATRDSFALSHFDGSFVYVLTGQVQADSMHGVLHAGLRSQTPFTAVRGHRQNHLPAPTTTTTADSAPLRFAFPDLEGRVVRSDDARFRGKVVIVDVFGTWCPTCHDAEPALVQLYRDYHARGLEIVGLAYEVSGDSTIDAPLVRRFRDKFGVPFPLLLAGTNGTDAAAATMPQLTNLTSFPTSIFLGRDGRVRRIHAGFYGPVTGAQHTRLIADFRETIEDLLKGPE